MLLDGGPTPGGLESTVLDLTVTPPRVLRPGLVPLAELERLAGEDKSPVVRLYLASALQRIPVEQRWPTLDQLVAHAEDASDHNLPLMYWYAAEPCVASDPAKAVALLKQSRIPLLREFIARRLATSSLKTVANK